MKKKKSSSKIKSFLKNKVKTKKIMKNDTTYTTCSVKFILKMFDKEYEGVYTH